MIVRFTIPGKPCGKGRPRFAQRGRFVKTYTPEQTVNYENLVILEYQRSAKNFRFEDNAALRVNITAYYPIPKSVSAKKRADMIAGAIRPTTKPDWDNIGKIVCDALNGIAYRDDSQIVDGRTIKFYAENPRVEVEMYEV